MLVPYVRSTISELYQSDRMITIGGDLNKSFLFNQSGSGTGGIVWPAAELFSNFIADSTLSDSITWKSKPQNWIWNDKVILELGSGLGVVATTLLHLGNTVFATDGERSVVEQLVKNIVANTEGLEVRHKYNCDVLEWGSTINVLGSYEPNLSFDLVVASDVVYGEDYNAWDLLLHTIRDTCERRRSPGSLSTQPTLVLLAQV